MKCLTTKNYDFITFILFPIFFFFFNYFLFFSLFFFSSVLCHLSKLLFCSHSLPSLLFLPLLPLLFIFSSFTHLSNKLPILYLTSSGLTSRHTSPIIHLSFFSISSDYSHSMYSMIASFSPMSLRNIRQIFIDRKSVV